MTDPIGPDKTDIFSKFFVNFFINFFAKLFHNTQKEAEQEDSNELEQKMMTMSLKES